jgi:hypothetical protein
MANLLDFDIPPMPTPRSIPTVTPRELESLKSGFLSEISSLKASLAGKEAEATALKTALVDAEKRSGEERERTELLIEEKDVWEKRGRDMEDVLRKVKEEIVLGQRERDELEAKLDEANMRREAAEMMAQEAESKMAGMRAGAAAAAAAQQSNGTPEKSRNSPGPGGNNTAREVELAVERVARELHSAYKSKHEHKVAALKKSYEARWEKRVRELEGRCAELQEEGERLRVGRDATMTRLVVESEADKERRSEQAAQLTQTRAEVDKLEAVVAALQGDLTVVRGLLEEERVEKGKLVVLAEELMSLQAVEPPTPAAQPQRMTPVRTSTAQKRMTMPATPSGTMGPPARASGLKPPGASRIGKPGVAMAARGGLMGSIERMGSYRRGGE